MESNVNKKIVDYVLKNTKRDREGRFIMPIVWNQKNVHLLGKNYNIAKSILSSTYKKLCKEPEKLNMYDQVFKEQIKNGIIEEIENLDQYIKTHADISFLPHMGVYKLERETSKCRVVFLSNLCEGKDENFSANQCILPGPALNHRIATAILLLRLDEFLITFDIKKAFLSLKLREDDSKKLLFLWYKDVKNKDFTIIGLKNLRVPFGLRCSPALLMLALYHILILDQENNCELVDLKRSIYNLIYMDNGAYTCNNKEDLRTSYYNLEKIFKPFKFELQQYCTNDLNLQNKIDSETKSPTTEEVKLFGMSWNRANDTLAPYKIDLDSNADTRRKILQTINAVYDIYNLYAPILLRAKLYLQKIAAGLKLSWDTVISEELLKEWKLICRQANDSGHMSLQRSIGRRGSTYDLIVFTDASKFAYGAVVFIKDIFNDSVSFLIAKNRILSEKMRLRTIPVLEFQGISFGIELIHEIRRSISNEYVVQPIFIRKLHLYSDSMAGLNWINMHAVKFDKTQKLTVFVQNRLKKIDELCRDFPVEFRHTAGDQNPAHYLTKPTSYKVLTKSCYLSGPICIRSDFEKVEADLISVVPNPRALGVEEIPLMETFNQETRVEEAESCGKIHVVDVDRYSNFDFYVNVYSNILKFCHLIKTKSKPENINFRFLAINKIISIEQQKLIPEVFQYLRSNKKSIRSIPCLISRFNLFEDENQVIRIKSKFNDRKFMPIYIPEKSKLTEMLIRHTHEKIGHKGIYSVLNELRKEFWIPQYFSSVRRVIRKCVICKRFNNHPIKLNQNAYRPFRSKPDLKPFSTIFIDYIGPFEVKIEGKRIKVWLLAICCLWSRGINIKITRSAQTDEFLRALQEHIFEYGLFSSCISDLGTQIQSGANKIKQIWNDDESRKFLSKYGINNPSFEHFAKGRSELGSLIEILVKQIKHLIFKTIRTNILDYFDFAFLIEKTICLINKRPIAFKDGLRSLSIDELSHAITPELILKGYETCPMSIIPLKNLVEDEDYSPTSPTEELENRYKSLNKVRQRLHENYQSEFLATLVAQAVDRKGRYKPEKHRPLKVGDVVLIVDNFIKRYNYQMGIVKEVEVNSLGETTAARVMKGTTREIVYRHCSTLILLVPKNEIQNLENSVEEPMKDPDIAGNDKSNSPLPSKIRHSKRLAARKCAKRNAAILRHL